MSLYTMNKLINLINILRREKKSLNNGITTNFVGYEK